MNDDELDLSVAPLTYPGPMIERSVLLRVRDGGQVPLGRPPADLLAGRTPVLAVGSNASAGVMLFKLRRGGAGGELPLVRARVRNLRIAPSAHVSRAGFIPAAPAQVEGAVSEVVIGWLDRAQLDCVDRTEPNYRRVTLGAGDYPLELEFVVPHHDLEVYESLWGVLGDAAGPIRLPAQTALAHWLGGRGIAPWKQYDAVEAVARLAGSLQEREDARDAFRALGLTVDSGLRVSPAR